MAVINAIIRAAAPPPEFVSSRSLRVTFELRARERSVTFLVAHASMGIQRRD